MEQCNPECGSAEFNLNAVVPQREISTSPFIHRFETAQHKYIYDVNTGRMLKVDTVIWDIVEDFGILTKDQIVTKHCSHYTPEEILAAYTNIRDAQQQRGLLLSNRPKQIMMPHTEECMRQMLAKKREQLILNVTEVCNFRCAYCVFGEASSDRRMHSNQMMSWDIAKAAIDDFIHNSKESTQRAVTFYGGEPLLNFELLKQCIEYIRQNPQNNNIHFGITTNGSLLTDVTGKFLASKDFNIAVSLDGPQHIHDKHRRGRDGCSTWQTVINNVLRFLNSNPEYRTNGKMRFIAVLAPGTNVLEVDKFFSTSKLLDIEVMSVGVSAVGTDATIFLESLPPEERKPRGMDELYEVFVHNLLSGKLNDKPADRMFMIQRGCFEETFLRLHKRPNATQDCPLVVDKMCVSSTCIPGIRRSFVTVNGDYLPCERVPESNYLKIGNVREGIDVSKVREIYKEWVECNANECRLCWCVHLCQAGCWSRVHKDGILTQQAKQKACGFARGDVHLGMVKYSSILEKKSKAFDYMDAITVR